MSTAKLRLQVDSEPPDYAHELGFLSKQNVFFIHLRQLKKMHKNKNKNTDMNFKIKILYKSICTN